MQSYKNLLRGTIAELWINGLYHTIGQQNKALNESWSTNLASEIIKYEQNEEQIILEARKRERMLWICIIALVALSLSLTIIVITRKNRILTMSRDADMEAISRLNDTVRDLASSRTEADQRHASEMENLRTSISDSRSIIRDLMASRFTEFSDLCQVYFQHEGHKNSQIKIYNEVKELISKVSSDSKFMKAVEAKINASLNDLMKNFRRDFTNLNDWEYTLFMYNVCGIGPKIIALFLGLKPELIHKRKANLKRKIATSDTHLKDEYLSFLS